MLAVIGSDLNPQPSSLGSIDIESQDLYSDQSQETSAEAEDEANSPRSLQTLDLQSSSNCNNDYVEIREYNASGLGSPYTNES